MHVRARSEVPDGGVGSFTFFWSLMLLDQRCPGAPSPVPPGQNPKSSSLFTRLLAYLHVSSATGGGQHLWVTVWAGSDPSEPTPRSQLMLLDVTMSSGWKPFHHRNIPFPVGEASQPSSGAPASSQYRFFSGRGLSLLGTGGNPSQVRRRSQPPTAAGKGLRSGLLPRQPWAVPAAAALQSFICRLVWWRCSEPSTSSCFHA